MRANASKNTLIMKKTVKKDLAKIDEDIKNYMSVLETLDSKDKNISNHKMLKEDIEKLAEKKEKMQKDLELLETLGKEQFNKTDHDATSMSKPSHNLMAYNSQIAVDHKYKFIVATDISTNGHDLKELHNMATKTKEIVNNPDMIITADKGYYSTKEIKKCIEDGIETIIPPRNTAAKKKIQKSKFSKSQFTYNHIDDCHICPNNKELHKIEKQYERNGRMLDVYRISSTYCKVCPLKQNCLSDKTSNKQMYRWEHEVPQGHFLASSGHIIDDYVEKMKTPQAKKIVKLRGSIVEHPFGTIKRTLGWDHFLVRSKKKVLGENALIMFTYNFKRLLNLIGIALFKKLCIAIKENNLSQIREEIAAYILLSAYYMAYFWRYIFFKEDFCKKLRFRKI